jgi:hypothetical protein
MADRMQSQKICNLHPWMKTKARYLDNEVRLSEFNDLEFFAFIYFCSDLFENSNGNTPFPIG